MERINRKVICRNSQLKYKKRNYVLLKREKINREEEDRLLDKFYVKSF